MADVKVDAVPFTEAIEHFRQKLNIPTRHWDELLGEIHAKSFTVTGATKINLLNDIRQGIQQAHDNGSTITDFRKVFDTSVQKHGWTYKGKRGWRTRVIFNTNMRTAAMAGRWAQIQRTKDTRPYLEYLTVGDNRVRDVHRAWDGTILPIDDPWWDTHYPPNGFGCRCTVRTLNDRQLKREGKTVNGKAPKVELEERVNTRTGEVYGMVPKGIGTGWNYNVGKAWLGPEAALGQTLMKLPPALRKEAMQQVSTGLTAAISADFICWTKEVLKEKHLKGSAKVVGYLNNAVVDALGKRDIVPQTAAILISDRVVKHIVRDKKRERRQAISEADVLAIPEHLAKPEAVLFQRRDPALLYVFNPEGSDDGRLGKVVVRVNMKPRQRQGKAMGEIMNEVRTGGLVPLRNLADTDAYDLIDGKLE